MPKDKGKSILANTIWMNTGFIIKVLIQAIYFIFLARILGVNDYGAIVGVSAIASVVSPFASLGAGNLLIKHVSKDKSLFGVYWGNAIILTVTSGLVLIVLLVLLKQWIFADAISTSLVILIGISDVIFARLSEVAGQSFQAFERLNWTAQFNVWLSAARFVSALHFCFLLSKHNAVIWGWYYLGSSMICAMASIFVVNKLLGRPRIHLRKYLHEIIEGFLFSISVTAQGFYTDIDKTMLSKMSSLADSGVYAAASRIIEVTFSPIRSILQAAYAKFFQRGKEGLQGTVTLARKLLVPAVGLSLVSGILLILLAPILPLILGESFKESVNALRWIALIPLVRSVHFFAADAMTGAGYQKVRSVIQVFIAGISVILNLILIPRYSWQGAAMAALLSNGILAISLWISIWYLLRVEEMNKRKYLSKANSASN